MRLPGFTGEASIYQTNRYYQMGGTLDQADNALRPAMIDPCLSACFKLCNRIGKLEIREACRDGCFIECGFDL